MSGGLGSSAAAALLDKALSPWVSYLATGR